MITDAKGKLSFHHITSLLVIKHHVVHRTNTEKHLYKFPKSTLTCSLLSPQTKLAFVTVLVKF